MDMKASFKIMLLLLLGSCLGGYTQTPFPYRDELAAEIAFWKSIFTRISADQVVLHDARYPQIIYKIIYFDSTVSVRKREREIKKYKHDIKKTLELLHRQASDSSRYSAWQRYIFFKFSHIEEENKFLNASRRIRAQQGIKENFLAGLSRSFAFLAFIEKEFEKQGLPRELVYLPHLESSFNPRAVSHVGARGLWQFMRSTGRLFMKVNRIVDQRLDPFESSKAAAQLLSRNFSELQDWALAITAYNYGLSGIKKAIRRKGKDYLQIRESYLNRRFGFASKSFYPEFLAIVEIMDSLDYYFPSFPREAPLEFHTLYLSRKTNLKKLIKQFQLDEAELRKLNPGFSGRVWKGLRSIPAGYTIKLPVAAPLQDLQAHYERKPLLLPRKAPVGGKAQASRKPLAQLPLPEFSFLKPGVFSAPGPDRKEFVDQLASFSADEKAASAALAEPVSAEKKRPDDSHGPASRAEVAENVALHDVLSSLKEYLQVQQNQIRVCPNETLGHIADWLHLSAQQLRELNRMKRNQPIYTGQRLRLQFSRVGPEEFAQKRLEYHLNILKGVFREKERIQLTEYTVKKGENLWSINFKKFKLPVNLLLYFNNLNKLQRLYPGEKIKLPVLLN